MRPNRFLVPAAALLVGGALLLGAGVSQGDTVGPAATPAAPTPGAPAASTPPPAPAATEPNLPPTRARSYLLRGATVLTVSHGTLSPGDVLVQDGRIAAVGAKIEPPADAVVLDLSGQFVSPGLIDAHSHSGVRGDVNECTDAVTSEVRISDILDPTSESLYRELAGGLTEANVLHGSCNPIGGQNAVIKLRYGSATPDELLFAEAPPGIKFALGENVKQSNWDDPSHQTRYPKTRMGVMEVIRAELRRAQAYRDAWTRYVEAQRRGDRTALPPRRDLQLEPLVEVLEGKRLVHCHSYRADEILALIRLAEEFHFRIATFQHALEAYRVADEIKAHGAGVSMFSDWWAYKMEVYDAISYNAALCWQHGVLVSLNSDSDEQARRLNTEAAKAVKYGGVPEDEAFKMVTLNPAIQLGIDKWVGSIEVGKHADLAVWSRHPLSTLAVCQLTFIDGKIYFDRQRDLFERKQRAEEKKALQDQEKQAAEKEKAEAKKQETPVPGTPTPPASAVTAAPNANPAAEATSQPTPASATATPQPTQAAHPADADAAPNRGAGGRP
jgi:imidazolonepropionase-like amidohydrolase